MLGCDIEAVPRNTEPNTNMRPYLESLGAWFSQRGLRLVVLDDAEVRACADRLMTEGTYWIATLRTGLPYTHAVVLRGSTPEWEPHGAQPWPAEPLALVDIGLLIERAPTVVEDPPAVR